MSAPARRFLGLDLLDETAGAIAARLAARPAAAPFTYLVTPNADHFARLARDPALAALYERASFRCLDSQAIGRAARLLRLHPPRIATGSDILAALLDGFLVPGDRVTVVGLCPEGVAVLRLRLPGVEIAHHSPPMGLLHDPAAIARAIRFCQAHPARFTLFALGSPVQERLAHALSLLETSCGIGLCIGAGLEFWTGARRRAPLWMRRLGMEWAFRLFQEPERLWRRYLIEDLVILRILLAERTRTRAARGARWPAGPAV